MQVIRLLIPKSETVSIRKIAKKSIFTALIAALALQGATLDRARNLNSSIDQGSEIRSDSVRLGLSRQRSDFIKAIDMLADAAGSNRHLAGYYESLTKRVKGDSTDSVSYSGIKVLHRVRKASTARVNPPAATSIAAVEAGREVTPAGLDPYLTGSIASGSPAAPANPVESEVAQSQENGESQPPAAFTVGDMAFDTNAAIEQWVNYYGGTPVGRRTMTIGLERSGAYIKMAREEFRNAGVPEDLVWLALVESVWNPRAVSPAAAGGIWQFIPSTATDYGLTVQTGNDERADPLKQTRVAAAYLHDLHTIFGDWALAMAAYNSGEPRVMSAIVKNGSADFWELYDKQLLPKETCNYVPKILAAIKIASQAELYGLPQSQAEPSAGS